MIGTGLCACGCGRTTSIARYTHKTFGMVKGQHVAYVRGHGAKGHGRPRLPEVKRYRIVRHAGNERVLLHRLRAEKALGKPLPLKAIVHHADGSRRDDAPLVICQDDAYHQLLHFRMRIKAAGGNPNTDLMCSHCKQVKGRSEFNRNSSVFHGFNRWCRVCQREMERRYAAQRNAS